MNLSCHNHARRARLYEGRAVDLAAGEDVEEDDSEYEIADGLRCAVLDAERARCEWVMALVALLVWRDES